ncbi:MAG: 2-C-methyl-D-erythritol 4-phosphate cytidylyltransferase [Actinomycetota bacterium]|nr:2-C-methyl-D-erythritol 4-phosphate cytidylyltransferase [Actinomycetota bacterium]
MTTQHPGGTRRVVGVVVAPAPSALGSQRLNGVRLVDHVLESLAELPGCDVVVVDEAPGDCGLSVSRLSAGYDVVLVHDPLCPLVPVSTLSMCLDTVGVAGVAVGVSPVTDTVKRVDGEVVIATVDRAALRILSAPVAFAVSLVPALQQRLPRARDLHDLDRLVDVLADLATPVAVQVPSFAHRVADAEDVAVLECLDGLRHSGGDAVTLDVSATPAPAAPRPGTGPRRR